MEPEIRSAWIIAGVKVGLGLFFLGTIIGIRLVTLAPRDVDGVRERSGVLEVRTRTEDRLDESGHGANTEISSPDSMGDRVQSRVREPTPAAASGARAGDRMVSCRLGAMTRFMTSDDCAVRGGKSTFFESAR